MRVAGAVLRSRYLFVRSRGEEAYGQVLAALSDDTRQMVENGFIETRWYPSEIMVEMMETADRLFGVGDLQLCEEMGRFSADNNLTTLYRIFFKFGSINFIIKRAAKAWRAQYDSGQFLVVDQGDTHVTCRLEDIPNPHLGVCLAIKGWMQRAGELSGEEVARAEMKCRARGDEVCEFHFEWK